MLYLFIVSLFFLNFSYDLFGMIELTSLDDAPEYYTYLSEKLANQPLFDKEWPMKELIPNSKVLPLEHFDDCTIISLLSENANSILRNSSWRIVPVWDKVEQLRGVNRSLHQGIMLWLSTENELCTLTELKQAYKSIIQKLQAGWTLVSAEQYPDIYNKYPESEWYLFIKNQSILIDETKLIIALANKFKLINTVVCSNIWLTQTKQYQMSNKLYLWIKKSHCIEFARIFKLYT